VILLTEAETSFLTNKAIAAGQKDVVNHIKAKLLKALELKGFEDGAIVNLANNFNLAKIKHVSTELHKRKTAPATYLPEKKQNDSNDSDMEEELDLEDLIGDLLQEELVETELAEEKQNNSPTTIEQVVADDLLSDLLDKDLIEESKKIESSVSKTTKKSKAQPKGQ
jgi:hypothetical protein